MSNVALNPFFAANSFQDQDTREEYAIVRRDGVSAPEIDRADAEVVEVTVRWGRTVLGVAHVALDGNLAIGEADGGAVMVPEEILGARSFTLVDKGTLVVPATGTCERTATGALVKGERAKVTFGQGEQQITVNVARVAAAQKTPRRGALKKGIFGALVGAFVAHGVAVLALSFAPPATIAEDDATLDRETKAYLLQTQRIIAAREIPMEDEKTTDGPTDTKGGEMGQAHKGEAGQSGSMDAPNKNAAYALKGPAESKEEHLARIRSQIESNQYLALGALETVFGGMNKGPMDAASQWEQELGHDAFSANGHLSGDELGDAYGYNGLGTTSFGPGGGAPWGDNLGLGKIGGFGGDGTCVGNGCFNTGGPGPGKLTHKTKTVSVLPVAAEINGIPREVVQRLVHANFPRFGQCYDHALKTDPTLEGVVTTTFIIDETGAVESVQVAKGLNPAVNECVAGVYSTLSFPVPDGSFGKARVTYSINFGQNN